MACQKESGGQTHLHREIPLWSIHLTLSLNRPGQEFQWINQVAHNRNQKNFRRSQRKNRQGSKLIYPYFMVPEVSEVVINLLRIVEMAQSLLNTHVCMCAHPQARARTHTPYIVFPGIFVDTLKPSYGQELQQKGQTPSQRWQGASLACLSPPANIHLKVLLSQKNRGLLLWRQHQLELQLTADQLSAPAKCFSSLSL